MTKSLPGKQSSPKVGRLYLTLLFGMIVMEASKSGQLLLAFFYANWPGYGSTKLSSLSEVSDFDPLCLYVCEPVCRNMCRDYLYPVSVLKVGATL